MILPMLWWLGLLVAALGVALSVWAVVIRGRARGRLRCRKCWYDMSGAVAAGADGDSGDRGMSGESKTGSRTCPECGRIATCDKHLLKTRRHWRLALLGLIVMAAGAGTSAWPMLSAKHWQRYAPSTALVFFADAAEPIATDETWKELAVRAKYDQLAMWQRRILAGRLGEGLAALLPATAYEHVELICLLRPPSSESLALELVTYGKIISAEADVLSLAARRDSSSMTAYSGSFISPRTKLQWKLNQHARVNEAISYAGTDIGRGELIRLLESEKAWIRDIGAAVGLARIGDEQAINTLCSYLAQEPIRTEAYFAVASIGFRARTQAEPILLGLIDSGPEERRQDIENSLAVLRGEVEDVTIPLAHDLMHIASTEFSTMRTSNRLLTTSAGPLFEPGSPANPQQAVPVLVEYLGSESKNVRAIACEVLQRIGPNARPALPALNALLDDPEVATQAQLAIDAIRRPD